MEEISNGNMHFWAKTEPNGNPGVSVLDHMLNVGFVAKFLAEDQPLLLERFQLNSDQIAFLSAMHDIGKITPGFQMKCEAWLVENELLDAAKKGCWDSRLESDHGKVSQSVIQEFLLQKDFSRTTAKYLAAVLGSHHGRLKRPEDRGIKLSPSSNSTNGINWAEERLKYAGLVWDSFKPEGRFTSISDETPSTWWLAGLTSVADWIGSDERFFSPERSSKEKNPLRQAMLALNTIGFARPKVKEGLSFKEIFGFNPYSMQEKVLEAVNRPGVYVVEAPMGMGKTEAALGAAYHMMESGQANGIYFALPTQATSNRIHIRMNEFLEKITLETHKSRLIHSNSWLIESESGLRLSANSGNNKRTEDARAGYDWFASSKRSLIAPFGVGTVDQALLGVVAAKHFFVRHFALAGKVVILDEIHSYDLYTGSLIRKLVTVLENLGCTVIILSATLTAKRRNDLVPNGSQIESEGNEPYPLITGRADGKDINPRYPEPPLPKKITIEFISEENAIKEAVKLASSGASILFICNTVDSAQDKYLRIKQVTNDRFPVGLLHSRFPFWKREQIEGDWMERFGKTGDKRCGSVLVSTQIVEQSVDLDADLIVTELAPTDMILQRLGRLWRHERPDRPVDKPRLCIIEESDSLENLKIMEPSRIKEMLGVKANVYAPYVLLRSLEVLKNQKNEIEIPLQIRQLLESTYIDRENDPESWQELYNEWFGSDSAKRMQADLNSNIWMLPLDDHEGVQTRVNDIKTIPMVLCKDIKGNEIVFGDGSTVHIAAEQYSLDTARAMHRNTVKIYEYVFEKGLIEPCRLFDEYFFETPCAGIIGQDGKIKVNGLKKGISLSYSDEMGLVIEK